MAQGKLKVKAKLPSAAKAKSSKNKKGPPIQRRGNAPIRPKKTKLQEVQKIKQIISKTVNKSMEDELRKVAMDEGKPKVKKNVSVTTKK